MAIDVKEAKAFAGRWADRGDEKQDTQQFWRSLLRDVLHVAGKGDIDDPQILHFEHPVKNVGYADVWLADANTVIEQKSISVDLDKKELRRGKWLTPFEQAMEYAVGVVRQYQPRFIVTCNFREFRVYDRDKWPDAQLESHPFTFTLEEFGLHPDYLSFIVDPNNSRLAKQEKVSQTAGKLIGQFYDMMLGQYLNPNSETSRHSLNVLCVRIVFCLYCEDAGLFPANAFHTFLSDVPAQDVRSSLQRLFKALNTPPRDESGNWLRDPYDDGVNVFPYVNGGLFEDEVEIPNFTEEIKRFLLDKMSDPVDWSQISPTIFGGIFESTLNPEARRSGGMHYTSPENIHKVIDPLFLNGLKARLISIKEDDSLTPRAYNLKLTLFLKHLRRLQFLDPACGSGNFLTESYLCLRRLENEALDLRRRGQTALVLEDEGEQRISLEQFHGIEINDFAVAVAQVALWISRLQANYEYMMLFESETNDLPLLESAHIVHGNALRLDWSDVLPEEECSFVMGNPPYKGAHASEQPRSAEQTADLVHAFGDLHGVKDADYVAAWFAKAADYSNDKSIPVAFVATNSIGQGQQPAIIWPYLWKRDIKINFAYESFLWGNEADSQAAVAVTIVGFSKGGLGNRSRLFFETDYRSGKIKGIQFVDNIGPYLKPGSNDVVKNRSKPLSDIPEMKIGSQPIDDGNYIFKPDELKGFLAAEPGAKRFIHRYMGSSEFINNRERFILWLGDATPNDLAELPLCRERIQRVRDYRMASDRAATRKAAETPEHFGTEIIATKHSIVVPEVSSERRSYIPMGFMSPDIFCSNKLKLVPDASLYMYGVMQSQFHNAWMRAVAGRMKSDYSYSSGVVYNNFIWPDPTPEQREAIEACAQAVLDARDNYPDKSLADLYDPDKMPVDLLAAHKALDRAVEAAYGVDFNGDEEKIVAHLFKLYAEKTKEE